jgi:hypothetical protein
LEASTVRWNSPTEPFRILGNIHYVGTDGVAVYLITSPEGHVLIDAPKQRGGALSEERWEWGITVLSRRFLRLGRVLFASGNHL